MYSTGKTREKVAQRSGLAGRLDCVSLIDVAQLLVGQSGVLKIRQHDGGGYVAFDDGAIIAAEWRGFTDRDAFLEMALISEGWFKLDEEAEMPERRITLRADRLLFEAALYLDHWAAVWERGIASHTKLGWLGYTPEEKEHIMADPLRITLWNRFEHTGEVAEVVASMARDGYDRIDVLKALEALWDANVLCIVEPSQAGSGDEEFIPWLVRVADRVRKHVLPRPAAQVGQVVES